MEQTDSGYAPFTAAVKWSSLALRGLLALVIGILVLVWPGIAVDVVVLLFGVFIAIASVLTLVSALRSPAGSGVLYLLLAVLGIIVALLAVFRPSFIAAVLVEIIAILMLITGIFDLTIAATHPEFVDHRWLLAASGLLSVVLAVIFIIFPLLGAMVLVAVYLGVFMIIFGLLSLALGFRLKGLQKKGAAA
jgi:uncharacterized membrane protein HdeD (DUF308 family)